MKTEITIRSGRLHVATPYSPILIDRFRTIPDRRFDGDTKAWTFPLVRDVLLMVVDALGVLPWMLPDDVQKVMEKDSVLPAKTEPEIGIIKFHQFRTAPFAHQRINLARLMWEDRWLLADEQGTGKSHAIVNRLTTLPLDHDVLIVCPKSVCSGWQEQLRVHGNIDSVVVDGTPSRRIYQLRSYTKIKIVNYELLLHSYDAIKEVNWDVVVFDEIHRVKSWTAKTSKVARELSKSAAYVWGLSGTPAPNGLEDWFGVIGAVNPALLPVSTKTAFESRYCVKSEIQPGVWKVSGYRNVAELHGYISSITSRVTKEQCLDLPPKLFETRHVSLDGEQRRIYDELKKKAVARLVTAKGEGVLTIRNVLTESLRLLQVVGGFVPSDDGEVVELDGKAKMVALTDILDECGGKQVVIWCCFRPEVKMLTAWLEENYGPTCNLLGGMDQEDRWENLEGFRSGQARYFVGTAAAGGTGINQLVVADTAVYYSRDFNYAVWSQSQDRIHRIGTRSKVTIFKLVARGTVDEKVDAALDKKEGMLDMMLRNPEEAL